MSPPEYERAPDRGSEAPQESAHHRPAQNTTPTQYDRVLAMLLDADEVCGSALYRAYIPRFGAVIHRLRRQGYIITKRPCDRHGHEGTAWLYRLEALPFDPGQGR